MISFKRIFGSFAAYLVVLCPIKAMAVRAVPILATVVQQGEFDPKAQQRATANADTLTCVGSVLNRNRVPIYTNCKIEKETLEKTPIQALVEGNSFCTSKEELLGSKMQRGIHFGINRLPAPPPANHPKGLIIDYFIPAAKSICETYCFYQAWMQYEVKKTHWENFGFTTYRNFIEAHEPYSWMGGPGDLLDKSLKKYTAIQLTGQVCPENEPSPLQYPMTPMEEDMGQMTGIDVTAEGELMPENEMLVLEETMTDQDVTTREEVIFEQY